MPRPLFPPRIAANGRAARIIPRLWRIYENILSNLEDDVAGRPRGSRPRYPRRRR